jgi:hypothetical protein
MTPSLILAVAAVVLGILGLIHVVGTLVLAVALLFVGLLWLADGRGWLGTRR